MKRLVQFMFFLITIDAVAQEDFYNDYKITINGYAIYEGDLSEGCGSEVNVVLEFEDGTSEAFFNRGHGGGWLGITGYRVFSSKNKVKGIRIWSRAYEQGDRWESCGSRHIGEGVNYIPIDTASNYSCMDENFAGYFTAYDVRSFLNVKIEALTSKSIHLNIRAKLINDANEGVPPGPAYCSYHGFSNSSSKINFNYSLQCSFDDSSSEIILAGHQDVFLANREIENFASIPYGTIKYPFSLNLSAEGSVVTTFTAYSQYACQSSHGESFSQEFAIQNPSLFEDTVFTFPFYRATNPSTITIGVEHDFRLPIYASEDYLPGDSLNRVTLLGPANNPPSFYHWVYSTDGTNWNELSQFYGQHRIQVCGYDIFGEDFINYHNRNIMFKLLVGCDGGESEAIILSGRVAAPNIVSLTPLPDRCYDHPNDGSFRMTFDRSLLPTERLNIFLEDATNPNPSFPITLGDSLDVSLDENNSFTWARELTSRSYIVKVASRYQGADAYSDNRTNHSGIVALVRPEPISSSILTHDVNCFNGGDGAVTITVRGGVGNYNLDYAESESSPLVNLSLGTDTTYTKESIRSGIYQVYIRDGNNCGDEAGMKSFEIEQPDAPVTIAYTSQTDPRAYGYRDGYIHTIITGGTPDADGGYSTQWYDPTNLLADSLYHNMLLSGGYQANVDSLGDGKYILYAFDSRYALANPEHRAGCMVASDTFNLVQPLPLVVTLREHHFINCFNYSNGELVAHADGGVKVPNGLPYTFEWLKENSNGATTALDQRDSIALQLRAGVYRVRVTDNNNIKTLSPPFALVEPELLRAELITTPVSCSSGIDGTVNAIIKGGTSPYSYQWSNGVNTAATLNQVIEGVYFVLVTDNRGCTTTKSGRVNTPYPLRVDSLLRQPQCFGYANGSIDITVAEGTPPYRYEWSNGATTEDIDGLTEGTYRVMIVDQNNCRNYREYVLVDPEPVKIELGEKRFLCNGQVLEMDVALPHTDATYVWRGPENFSTSTSKVRLEKEGLYHVDVTDSRGCKGTDELNIERLPLDVGSEFLVTTQGFTNEEVTLLNITTPVPDSVSWWMNDMTGVTFNKRSQNIAVLTFNSEGYYTISMTAYRQGCESVFSKTITVLGKSFTDDNPVLSSHIDSFSVSPNPSDGVFTVTILLQEELSIRVRLISLANNVVVNDRIDQESNKYVLPYATNLAAGSYMLLLETPKGSSVLKLVVH